MIFNKQDENPIKKLPCTYFFLCRIIPVSEAHDASFLRFSFNYYSTSGWTETNPVMLFVSCVVIIFIREDDGHFAHRVSLVRLVDSWSGGGQSDVLLWWLVSHVLTDSSAPSPHI